MLILPDIDIKDGKCVRLLKGSFEKITKYKQTPLDQAKEFSKLGFKNVHIIDLDGALEGNSINKKVVVEIVKNNNLDIQVGGGIRSLDSIESWLDIGVDKVVLGTSAVLDKKLLEKACTKFDKKIVVSIDVRNGLIALNGWKKQTEIKAIDFVKEIKNLKIARIIYTDINKDGTKEGPNIEETINFSKNINFPVLVSGGVSSISDITNIKKSAFLNIAGVIVGRAIYDETINIKDLSELL